MPNASSARPAAGTLNHGRRPAGGVTTANSTTVSSATTSSLCSSESASQISSDCYLASVVWTTQDCKTDPHVGGSVSNSSQPPMHHTVQYENGKMISEPEWKLIHQSAFTVTRSNLVPLWHDPCAIAEKMHKKTFLKGNFLNKWLDAVTALKHLCPLLSLCTRNWKGDMVLGSVLKSALGVTQSSRSSTPSLVSSSCPPPPSHVTSSSRAGASRPSTPSSVAPSHPSQLSPRHASFKSPHPRPCALSGLVQSPWEPELASKAGSKAKRRCDPSLPRRNRKHSKASVGASGTSAASNPVQWSSSPHPAFMSLLQSGVASQSTPSAKAAPPPKALRSKQDRAMSHAKAPSTRAAKAKGNCAMETDDNDDDVATQPVSGSHPVTPVDDPCPSPRWGAQVQVRMATSSFENLSEPAPAMMTRSKQDHAASRTRALSTQAAKAKCNCAAVMDGDGDNGNNNNGNNNNSNNNNGNNDNGNNNGDNNNGSNNNMATQPVSGSRPVTPIDDPGCQSPRWGAQVQVRMATLSFENLSKPAPAMMTRSKQDHTTTQAAKVKDSRSTTDDDMAAQSQSKSRLVAPAEDPGHESPDQARMAASSSESSDDDDELHLHLQVLLHDELRQWVDRHKIKSQGKRPTRIDLIKAIAGAPKLEQPSKEDIKSIVNERKSRHNMKAA
ncbi:hypothetical protein EDB89DRAFT_2084467 [Lactarius sanguifluus]|nr:hypothetical protein EDB89DRAFT_2084467 [Lactarius sanguifluus]